PGVTNLMVRRAADQMDRVEEVFIAFASFRSIAPSPGLLDTVLDEFSPGSQRFFWQEGQFVEVPLFSGTRRVRFAEPAGELEVYYVPHSETHTLPRFLGKGVRRVSRAYPRRLARKSWPRLKSAEPASWPLRPVSNRCRSSQNWPGAEFWFTNRRSSRRRQSVAAVRTKGHD